MKRIPIFRAGTHTAMSGARIEFTEDQLREAAASYKPASSEAPIVVGHPKTDDPAYGWVKSLEFDEATKELVAIPHQLDEAFADMVDKGRFKNRSASWYLPEAENNPTPGKLYLKHVGFLGAKPPAVKGLRAVEFADEAEGVVEFVDSARWAWSSVAAIMRGMREWVIGEKGVEAADKVLPNYLLSDIDAAAKAADTVATPAAMPAFSEGNETMMTAAEQAKLTALEVENAALKKTQVPANFAEREADVTAREAKLAEGQKAIARAGVESRIDAAVKAGKVLPAAKKGLVEFAASLLDTDATIEFGEGDKAKKVTQREAYLLQVEAGPKLVDYEERAGAEFGEGAGGNKNLAPLEDVQRTIRDQVKNGGKKAA